MLDARRLRDKRYPALFAAMAAVLLCPFYLGLVHLPVRMLGLYSGVASLAMAVGQYVDTPSSERGGVKLLGLEWMLWLGLTTTIGGLAYLAALIF